MDKRYLELLELEPYDFDQSEKGWRKLDQEEQYFDAAKLIELYISTNKEKILNSSPSLPTMYFHAGQLYAIAGREFYDKAIKNFKLNYKDIPEWNYYVDGTIAFLEEDLEELKRNFENLKQSNKAKYAWHMKFFKYCIDSIGNIDYKNAYEKS